MRNPEANRLLLRLAGFLPLVGALLLIDWISLQPAGRHLLAGSLDGAANAMVAGKTIWSRVAALYIKPVWIEHLQSRPEVVVLGSSRAIQVSQEWFRPRTMLNAALLQGDFQDAVAIFEECLETGKTPREVVLEVNPSLAYADKARVSPALASYFRHALVRYRMFPRIFFSGPLTLEGVRWDARIYSKGAVWRVAQKFESDGYLYRPDGSMDWSVTESSNTPDEVERGARSEMVHLDPEHQLWRATSQPGWFDRKIWQAFMDDLRGRGIRVVLLLVPVHPAAYDFYRRQGGYDDTWLRSDAQRRGITVVGSYSPGAAKVTREDFYDDVHVHAEVLHRLLREGGVVRF